MELIEQERVEDAEMALLEQQLARTGLRAEDGAGAATPEEPQTDEEATASDVVAIVKEWSTSRLRECDDAVTTILEQFHYPIGKALGATKEEVQVIDHLLRNRATLRAELRRRSKQTTLTSFLSVRKGKESAEVVRGEETAGPSGLANRSAQDGAADAAVMDLCEDSIVSTDES